MRRKPFSVVLFDEVEKAHPDIFNSLLQILEDGRLTDSQGRVVDFKNTVIIMTTNLGTRDITRGVNLGFANEDDTKTSYERMKVKVNEELKNHFRPEFLNRIDDIIVFHQLTRDQIVTIVDLMIAKLDERLRDKDMGIELTQSAKDALAIRGYDQVLRARRCDGPFSATSRMRSARRSCSARFDPDRSCWSTPREKGPTRSSLSRAPTPPPRRTCRRLRLRKADTDTRGPAVTVGPFACLAVGGGNGAGAAFVGAPFLGTRGVGPGSCGPSDVGGVGSGFGLTPAAPSGDAAVAESEPAALRPAIGSRPERRRWVVYSRWISAQPLELRGPRISNACTDLQRMYRSPTPVAHRCALLLPGAGGETFLHASAVGRQATETHPDQSATIGRAALPPGVCVALNPGARGIEEPGAFDCPGPS